MLAIKKIILHIFSILAIFILHIFAVSFLPPPLNHLNVIVIALLWILLYRSLSAAAWTALALGFIMELYSSAPFGLQMAGLIASILLVQWLLITVFTSHSVIIALLAGLIACVAYRGIVLLLVVAIGFITRRQFAYGNGIWLDYLLELTLTSALLAVSVIITRRLRQRLNPRYITIDNT